MELGELLYNKSEYIETVRVPSSALPFPRLRSPFCPSPTLGPFGV